MSLQHLTLETAKLLESPLSDRILAVRRERWIGYPRAKQILKSLTDLIDHPKTHRMPNMLLVGESNNGKTKIIDHFERGYPREMCPESERTRIPVLVVQAPPNVDEGRLYTELLHGMKTPFKAPARVDQRQHLAIRQMRLVDVRILIIDEFHNALSSRIMQRNAFLNAIRYLGNELQIPIVASGTKQAFSAVQTDPQLANRFLPEVLPRWNLDDDFRRLLSSFEKLIPLPEASGLSSVPIATRIHAMTEGTIGEVAALLSRAAIGAMEKGKTKIDERTLNAVGYVSPSKRQRSA